MSTLCVHCGEPIGEVWYPQNSTPENRRIVWVHLAPHDSYSPAACPPTVAEPAT